MNANIFAWHYLHLFFIEMTLFEEHDRSQDQTI